MEKIYEGLLVSRENRRYVVTIERDGETDGGSGTAGELRFSGEEPLMIEWDEKGKEEAVCGSVATLKVISPGDRTYWGLYGVKACQTRLTVTEVGGGMVWAGTMDPEQYEEPYSSMDGYEVTLTFSDLNVLDRLKPQLPDTWTLRGLLEGALEAAGLADVLDVDDSLVSTHLPGGTAAELLDGVSVWGTNWRDEDGEKSTWQEVVEGAMQPLGLRVVQRGGRLVVYDLNGLRTQAERAEVTWMSDDQMLGADVVYNRIRISWSPYVKDGNLLETDCWSKKTDAGETALNMPLGKDMGDGRWLLSWLNSVEDYKADDPGNVGWSMWLSTEGSGVTLGRPVAGVATNPMEGQRPMYMKAVPQLSGEEAEGVAISWKGLSWDGKTATVKELGVRQETLFTWDGRRSTMPASEGVALMTTKGVTLPPLGPDEDLYVKIRVEMMADPRWNPWVAGEKMGDVDAKLWQSDMQSYQNMIYVPVTVKARAVDTGKVWVWDNRDAVSMKSLSNESSALMARCQDAPLKHLEQTLGKWVEWAEDSEGRPLRWGYLAWYDKADRHNTSGGLGWKSNQPAINPHQKGLGATLTGAREGQYVPWPKTECPRGFELTVEVRHGGWCMLDTNEVLRYGNMLPKNGRLWHVLMKLPEVELTDTNPFIHELDTDDVDYSGLINRDAKEDLELETVCGTKAGGLPMAMGSYLHTDTLQAVTEMVRAGRQTQVEELLIGTMMSQYGERHEKLTGTVALPPWDEVTLEEAMTPGVVYMRTGGTVNVQDDTEEVTLVEVSADEWEKDNL